jgi:hypothetical protein
MRRLSLGGVCLATSLVGCGYTPLYAPITTTDARAVTLVIGAVEMETVDKRPGERRVAQVVAQDLMLAYPDSGAKAGAAKVNVAVREETSTLSLNRTAVVQRAEVQLRGIATVVAEDGQTLLTTQVNTSAPYNVENNPFSTESGKTFARQTAARNLAAELTRRLALFQRTYKPAKSIKSDQ